MKNYLFILLVFVSSTVFSQGASIKGRLIDTSGIEKFKNASVMLLNAYNNKLINFTRTNANGEFRFVGCDTGYFKIVASASSFADMAEYVTVAKMKDINLGSLNMIRTFELMEAVVINAKRAAIEMRGDTVIYTADSFKTFEGANVEDLLRKLPGVQVDRNGKITAQGKTVDRVLVDGEEFFGDDASIATKNLNARNVDAVKVYDAQSSDAKASGDAATLKVMDIRLKDNAKQGWIGKLTLGGAKGKNHDLYDAKLFVNNFQKKERFGIYGISANSPEVNISWSDKREFTNNINSSFDGDGNVTSYFSGSDFDYWLGYSQGLPMGNTTYGYYQNKFKNDKISLNINGGYKDLLLDTRTESRTKNLLSNNTIDQLNSNTVKNYKNRADFGISTEFKLDTLTTLGIGVSANQDNLINEQNNDVSSFSQEGFRLNTQSTKSTVEGTSKGFGTSMFFRRNFANKDKYFGANFSYGQKNTENTTDFESNVYAADSFNASTQNFAQNKNFNGLANSLNARAFYYQPVNDEFRIIMNSSFNSETQASEKFTFNKNEVVYIDSLSSKADYMNSKFTNSLALGYKKGKIRFELGASHNLINLRQSEDIRGINLKQDPISFITPTFEFSYRYYTQGNLRINYYNNIQNPSLSAIQPIIDNINPINLNIGNPDLKNSNSHSLNFQLYDNRTFKNRYIWANLSLNTTQNAFVSSTEFNSKGQSVTKQVNSNGVYGINGNLYYYKKMNKWPLNLTLNYQPSFNNYTNFINNIKNVTQSWSQRFSPGIGLDLEVTGIDVKYNYTINSSKASVFQNFTNNNTLQGWEIDLYYNNPKYFDLEVEIQQNTRPTNAVFKQNANNFILSANISRHLDKKRNFVLTAGVYDLFNQNLGYSRNVYQNTITENTFNTFTQFFYGRISWRFNKLGANTKKTAADGLKIDAKPTDEIKTEAPSEEPKAEPVKDDKLEPVKEEGVKKK